MEWISRDIQTHTLLRPRRQWPLVGHGENYFDLTIDDDDDTPVKKGSVTDDDRNCSG
jgi:hypothetical protein